MEFERNVLVSPPMEVPRQHRADAVRRSDWRRAARFDRPRAAGDLRRRRGQTRRERL